MAARMKAKKEQATPKTPRKSSAVGANPYSVHPGVAMIQGWIATLKETTGRSLDEWMAVIKKSAPPPRNARTAAAWLKAEHGIGSNKAGWLAERAFPPERSRGFAEEDPAIYLREALRSVDEQYSGKKAALRPLYERLLTLGLSVGKDAKACPCATIVPLYREHVFAQIKPTTNTRIDLGLALGKFEPESKIPARIIDTGGKAKKDRITHRIAIETEDDIDEFVERWLGVAYRLDERK